MTTQPTQPGQPVPGYRLPAHPPADGTADNLTRWRALIDGSSARSTLTAQTWRNGLAGFVTLLTSVLILKGSDIGKVEEPRNYMVIALLALGAAAAIWGLWAALNAEAPPLTDVDYSDTVARHGSIAAYEQNIYRSSATALAKARHRVFAALVLLLAGSVTWWLSPTAGTDPRLQVTWEEGGKPITICGTPNAAPAGQLSLTVKDEDHPTEIPLDDVDTVRIVDSC